MSQNQAIFTAEQEELRSTARRFLQDKSPSEAVRQLMETPEGFDEATWKEMASLGWTGIHLPESYGGVGYGFGELAVLLEEMGRVLLCSPFLATCVLAASAISHAGTENQKKDLLSRVADGSLRATLARTEPSGRWDEKGVTVTATKKGTDYVLDGTKRFIVDGNTAQLLIVAARTDAGVSFFVVDPSTEGVVRTQMETLDLTRKMSNIEFSSVKADLLGEEGNGEKALERILQEAVVALAAESVGGAQRCLDSAIEYANQRIAFGRPIGSFQAIKHKAVNVLLQVENAKSAAAYAAWCVGEAPDALPVASSMAKAYCGEAFFNAAAENIQIHGGIGFTWEHDAHLYFRRAKSSEIYLGDGTYHRELLAQRLGV